MQSLFNKRNQTNEGVSSLFSQPHTNIIKVETPKVQLPTLSSKQPIDEEPENIQQTQQQRAEKLSRTIFIGNVKIETNKKQIKKLLQPYGKVEKVWYRSVPVEQSKMGPKASFIMKKFQQDAESMNAYARFQKIDSVEQATELNGTTFNGLTIRVTPADNKELDFKKTIFIGNLPFDLKEQQLRQFCSKVGTIQNVRVIRNKFTHKGIGIAYVMFDSQQVMKNAIKQLNGKTFKQRSIRVKKAVEKKRLEKKKNKFIDPKTVNRNAAVKRIQERNKEARKNQRHQKREQKASQSLSQSKPPQKPIEKSIQKSEPKYFKSLNQFAKTNNTVQAKSQIKNKGSKNDKNKNINQKKIPLNQKKKPHVTSEMDEEDKNLSKQVKEQLKLLKRNMITKSK